MVYTPFSFFRIYFTKHTVIRNFISQEVLQEDQGPGHLRRVKNNAIVRIVYDRCVTGTVFLHSSLWTSLHSSMDSLHPPLLPSRGRVILFICSRMASRGSLFFMRRQIFCIKRIYIGKKLLVSLTEIVQPLFLLWTLLESVLGAAAVVQEEHLTLFTVLW